MFLSRLVLNPRSRAVWRDLADCHSLHRTVMSAFPEVPGDAAREQLGVLYRLDARGSAGALEVLVQSKAEPDWSGLPPDYLLQDPGCKDVSGAYRALKGGEVLRFRITANPTRKVDTMSGPNGQRRNGRRVELRSDEERLAWLQRKAERGGFELLSVRAGPVPDVRMVPGARLSGWRDDRHHESTRRRMTFCPVTFEGHLRVVDPAVFRETLASGIGPAKAFGFGLLSVAPAVRLAGLP